jgi:hypothetical protein
MLYVSKNIGHRVECRAGFRRPKQIFVVSLSLSSEITVTNSAVDTTISFTHIRLCYLRIILLNDAIESDVLASYLNKHTTMHMYKLTTLVFRSQ